MLMKKELIENNKILLWENRKLQERIDKAIEYIEKHTENIDRGQYYEDYVETYPILEILKGEDKE